MMSAEQVREALRQAFPSDNFSLYQATSFGFLSDAWAVAFLEPPKTTTNKIVFKGTRYGERGDWSSPVVAAGEQCYFCVWVCMRR